LCLDSCFFEARQLKGGVLSLIDERCFGCGRCIGSCPGGAIRLESQPGRGVPIPFLSPVCR
ncbi:MAG: 4Fe-4S binding protein, partial [Anaerolineae bacterium]|nr:4Fe-4S binding protein [Anaerolineae bacterium]